MTPQEVADAYGNRGYDFIAFTDHDYLLKPDYRALYGEVKSDMIIFHGVENTVFVKGYVHVNRIDGENEVLHFFNHVSEYDLTTDQVLDRLEYLEKLFPIDAVEITSKGFRVKEFEDLPMKYPKLASDDSHSQVGVGRAWVELDARREKDSIIRAIKEGDFWNCYL
jgi:hypothetical protein